MTIKLDKMNPRSAQFASRVIAKIIEANPSTIKEARKAVAKTICESSNKYENVMDIYWPNADDTCDNYA